MTTRRPNTVALRLTDEVVAWADANAAAAGLKRSVWLAEFLQAQRDASPAGGPESATEVAILVDPGLAEIVANIEREEPDRHDGLLAGSDEVVPDLSLPDASEPDHAMVAAGGSVSMVADGTTLVREVENPAPAAEPPCSHPRSKLKTLGYATVCECGVRVR